MYRFDFGKLIMENAAAYHPGPVVPFTVDGAPLDLCTDKTGVIYVVIHTGIKVILKISFSIL